MSVYVGFTGVPRQKYGDALILREMKKNMKYVMENKEVLGDDDLDQNTYIVIDESGNERITKLANDFANDNGYKTVIMYPSAMEKRKSIIWGAFRRSYKSGNFAKRFFTNCDIVFCLGRQVNILLAADSYNCISVVVPLSNDPNLEV